MPSIVTDNFRVFAAEQFIESLEEPYSDSSGTTVPDGDAAGLSEAYRSKIYLFTGRPQQWNDAETPKEKYDGTSINEDNPPVETDSFNAMNEIYDDMISMKKVTRSDVSKVIRKIKWKSGVKYDMYKHDYGPESNKSSINGQTKLYDSQFYVMNSNFQVYKCIFNGESEDNKTGVASVNEPTGNSTTIFSTADTYRWKYMYTINISDYIKFVSTDFIPIKNETTVVNAAIDGSIDQIIVNDKKISDNTPGEYFCPVIGDNNSTLNNDQAIVKVTVNPGSTTIDSVSMEQSGKGYTRAKVLLEEGYGSLSDALNRTGTKTILTGDIEAIISPPGGHGSDASLELGGYRVMINKSLDFLDGSGDIPVDSQFRRYGLISDPKKFGLNADLTANTASACSAIKFPASTTDVFVKGKIITQAKTGAKGRVIHWDNVNKILRYYQNEFIDEEQTSDQSDPPKNVKYKLVPFSGDGGISDGSITVAPDQTENSTNFGITFVGGYATPEVKKNSGTIIYVENRKAINRSSDQIEDIKLVIEF